MYTAGQASALKNERTRSIPRASAGLLVHKPKTPSNSSLHLQSPVTKQRELVHAHQKALIISNL